MKCLAILVCLVPFCLQAQQPNVHIKAEIAGLEAGKKVYIANFFYKPVDSTETTANGFQFNFYIPEGEGDSYILQFGKANGMPNTTLLLYLEKGTVTIKGNGPMFNEVQVSGPGFIKDLNNYHEYIRSTVTTMDQLNKQVDIARKQKDTTAIQQLYAQIRVADSIQRALTTQWITKHVSSPISVYLLDTRYYYSGVDKQEALFKKLLPAAKNNAIGKKMQEQVLINDMNGIGKIAPGLVLKDTAGKQVSLKDFNGKYVLLDFWASWCVPCRQETPFLQQAIKQYGDKNFTIISVSIDTDTLKWMKAVRHDDMQWTNLIDPATNRSNGVLHGYYVPTVPTNLLIDPKARIIARNLRGKELGKKLKQVFTGGQKSEVGSRK